MFDYEMLRLVWWVLVGVLLIGFAITDGFDMGVGTAPLRRQEGCRASGDAQHHGPALEGNQVWLVTPVVPCLLPGPWSMPQPSPASTSP